jgi:Protein-glutamine gamma-glutamyltransferase
MIIIASVPYDPAPDIPAIEDRFGKDMVEALSTMHNGGRPPLHVYATKAQLMIELNLRDKATEEMAKTNASEDTLRYATRSGDPPDGWLDPKYWDKVGFYQFFPASGASSAPAVRSIFGGKDNVLECNSAMVAVEYGSMLETMGNHAFDKRMADGSLIISPYHLPPRGVDEHPLFKQGMIETVGIAGAKDLIPGDWVYFRNIADYLTKHPNGFWSGEHALYLGGGKFQGFGTTVLTEGELREKLLDSYNVGLPPAQRKQAEDVPGLQHYANRPVVENIVK